MDDRSRDPKVIPLISVPSTVNWTTIQFSDLDNEDVLCLDGEMITLGVVGRIRNLYVTEDDGEPVAIPRIVVEPLRQKDLAALHGLLRRVGYTNYREAVTDCLLFTSNMDEDSDAAVLAGLPHVSPHRCSSISSSNFIHCQTFSITHSMSVDDDNLRPIDISCLKPFDVVHIHFHIFRHDLSFIHSLYFTKVIRLSTS